MMTTQRLCHVRILIVALLLLSGSNLHAQCNCTFTIPSGSYQKFDGTANGVKGGDVICVSAGSTPSVVFSNVIGTPGNPVIIKNCGGQAVIGTSSNLGISFSGSRYVHFTGTGVAGINYGFKIAQTKIGSQGFAYAGLSSDVEIDHVEIANAGFAGIMVKTDPTSNCADHSALRPNWTLYNVSIHDNYIYNSEAEGIYLGDSFYNGTTTFCGSLQYPHEVKGVRIFNNKFQNNGREAIQVGGATSDVEIYSNSIYNYGTKNISMQNGGVQLGFGTTAKFYGNFIKGGTGPALKIFGIGNEYVYNNVFVNPGEHAITLSIYPTPLSTDIVNKTYLGGVNIINNTFVNAAMGAVKEYVVTPVANVMYNNLIVSSASVWDLTYTNTVWAKANNVVVPLLANAKFVNPAVDDYHFLAASPAVNVGKDVKAWGVTFDYDKKNRPLGVATDAGAFEYGAPTPPVASAGSDKSITLPTNTLTLTGSATDADGTISSYAWTKQSGPAAILTNQTTATLSLSGLVVGTYIFRLTVTDNSGLTAYNEATVVVKSPPVVNAGLDKSIILPTNALSLTGTATDVDGTISSYLWTKQSGPAATLANATAATLSLSGLVAGTYVFRLTATDNSSLTSYDEVAVNVNDILYRINCGGSLTLDGSPSINWISDNQANKCSYLDPGSSNYTTGSNIWTGVNTTGAPNGLFGPNRYLPSYGTNLKWNFPVASGQYEVRLYFAESPYAAGVSTPGARVFSVKMESNTVLSNFDIYATAGMDAVKKVFIVSVTDGILNIDFVRGVGVPQVNGIEIITGLGAAGGRVRAPSVVETTSGDLDSLSAVKKLAESENSDLMMETIEVYPNPFQYELNLAFKSDQQDVSVSLVTMSGQVLYSGLASLTDPTHVTLDLSTVNIVPGIYILTIQTKDGKIHRRVRRE